MEPLFGTTRDGLTAAQVDGSTFAMMPDRHGGYTVVWRYGITGFDQLTRESFYSWGEQVADRDTFVAAMRDRAEDRIERAALARAHHDDRTWTPWGASQGGTILGEGVVQHSTASHGGILLDRRRNAMVDARWRNDDGTYEEDCDAAIVVATFPELFTRCELRDARASLKNWKPDAYAAVTGEKVDPSESRELRRGLFAVQHAKDWVVVSALRRDNDHTLVDTHATLGGSRLASAEQRRFVVPASEYAPGEFGFVIDPQRHRAAG